MTTSDYLNEYVEYGGAIVRRGEMVLDLQARIEPSGVSAYLSGHQRSQYSQADLAAAYDTPQNQGLRAAVLG